MSAYAYHDGLGTPSEEESDMKFHLFTILVRLNVKKKGPRDCFGCHIKNAFHASALVCYFHKKVSY